MEVISHNSSLCKPMTMMQPVLHSFSFRVIEVFLLYIFSTKRFCSNRKCISFIYSFHQGHLFSRTWKIFILFNNSSNSKPISKIQKEMITWETGNCINQLPKLIFLIWFPFSSKIYRPSFSYCPSELLFICVHYG